MLLLFFTLFSLFLFIFCLLCIFSIHFTYKFDDIPEHLWYNLENLITYLLRYQGQEVRKPMQACLRECKARSNLVSKGAKYLLTLTGVIRLLHC